MLEQVTWRHVGYAVLGAGVGGILGAGLLLAFLPALPAAQIVEMVRSVELFDHSAEHVEEREESWRQAINRGDVAAIVALYAPDAQILPPGAAAVVGPEAIRQFFQRLLSLPELSIEVTNESTEVAAAGDLAYSRGRFRMSWGKREERLEDRGKYLVVWRRIDGEWRAQVDAFNSDLPGGPVAAGGDRQATP
jgi:ketosteroid isomerase-like protein